MMTVEKALQTLDLALASAAGSRATIHVTRLRQVRDLIARLDRVRQDERAMRLRAVFPSNV